MKQVLLILLGMGLLSSGLEAFERKFFIPPIEKIKKMKDSEMWLDASGMRRERNYKDMITFCDLYLEHHPHSAQAYFWKGIAYSELMQCKEALENYNLSLKHAPKNWRERHGYHLGEVYYYRGLEQEELGQYQEALDSFEKGIELGYDDREIQFKRDLMACELNARKKAVPLF